MKIQTIRKNYFISLVPVVDGHDESAADAHRVADVDAVAEEGRDGGIDGGTVASQNVAVDSEELGRVNHLNYLAFLLICCNYKLESSQVIRDMVKIT